MDPFKTRLEAMARLPRSRKSTTKSLVPPQAIASTSRALYPPSLKHSNKLFRCPVTACSYHRDGMSSNNLQRHASKQHGLHISYHQMEPIPEDLPMQEDKPKPGKPSENSYVLAEIRRPQKQISWHH